MNYFLIFSSIIKNNLENIFQFDYIIENKLKIKLLIFFFKFIKIIRNKSYKLKS